MKIYELEITANAPSEQYAYVPADSDVGFSLNIKGKENLVPTGVFDEKGDIREPDGYLDEAQTVPFYKVHTLPENSAEKFQVEYTAENSEGEQVAMEFYVNVISTKSGFSYVAAGGGKEPDVNKAYVDENLALKQDKLTAANEGDNITITGEGADLKINAVIPTPEKGIDNNGSVYKSNVVTTEGNTIALTANKENTLYTATLSQSAAYAITWNMAETVGADDIVVVWLKLNVTASGVTVNWPETVVWKGDQPDLSTNNKALIAIMKVGNRFIANVQDEWTE